jgi:ribosome modulation factor
MVERFPFGKDDRKEEKKEEETLCRVCGQFGHSTENCPYLTKEQREEKIMRKMGVEQNKEGGIEKEYINKGKEEG